MERLRNILLGIPGVGELYKTIEKGVDIVLAKLFPLNIQLPLPKLDFGVDVFQEKIEQMSQKLFDRFTQLEFDLFGDLFLSLFQVDFLGDMMSKIPMAELGMPDLFDLESLLPEDCDDFMCVLPNVAGFEYLNGISLSQLENSAQKVLETSEAMLDSFFDSFGKIADGIGDCIEYTLYPIPLLDLYAAAMGLEDCPELSSINLCSAYSFDASLDFRDIGGDIASSLLSLFRELSDELNLNITGVSSSGGRALSPVETVKSPILIPIDATVTRFVPIDILLSFSTGGSFAWVRLGKTQGVDSRPQKKAKEKKLSLLGKEIGNVFDDPTFSALSIYFKPEVSRLILLLFHAIICFFLLRLTLIPPHTFLNPTAPTRVDRGGNNNRPRSSH